MTIEPLRLSLATLALVAASAACGGPDRNIAPQTPGVTTTTSGSPMDTEPGVTPPGEGPVSSTPPDVPRSDAVPLENPSLASPASSPPRSDSLDSSPLTDAQLAAVLVAIDNSETNLSRAALTKAKNWRVKEFAERMIKDYERAAQTLRAADASDGITPQDGTLSDQVRRRDQQMLQTLRSAAGSDFDNAYVDSQIEQHKKVIDLIDRALSRVQSPALRDHIAELRRKADGRLHAATSVKSSL